jgi:hypothetical protein
MMMVLPVVFMMNAPLMWSSGDDVDGLQVQPPAWEDVFASPQR